MGITDRFRLWNPPVFQGNLRRKTYFEGWYFKLVSADLSAVYAIIVGIALGRMSSKRDGYAFIQAIDGRTTQTAFVPFPIESFRFSRSRFEVAIGENLFSADGIRVSVDNPELRLEGRVDFSSAVPYPSTLFSPGAMGPFTFAPFMECYHGVVSMNHRLGGDLTVAFPVGNREFSGTRVDLRGGAGYIEKDWGRSFPSSWIWMQSNHFRNSTASIMVSIGRVPWLGSAFSGFMVVLWIHSRIMTFASYTGAKLTALSVSDTEVMIEIRDRRRVLRIRGHRGAHGILIAPVEGRMERRIHESIDARVEVEVRETTSEEALFADVGTLAGMEVAGNINELIRGAGL